MTHPLKNIDRCRNRRVVQRKKTGGRKRRKRRDVDVRNGREMVAGLTRKGRVIDTIWRRSLRAKKLNKFKQLSLRRIKGKRRLAYSEYGDVTAVILPDSVRPKRNLNG